MAMKNFIYLAIIPVLLILFSDRIKASPELIYSLSKEIRIQNSGEDGFENVQQLEVKNVGNDVASNIVIKSTGAVDDVNIEKFSNNDVVSKELAHGVLEIKYNNLLPGGSFSVVFRSKSKLISNKLEVVYEKGRATDAFSKEGDFKRIMLVSVVVFFILQIATSVYSMQKDSLIRDARSYLAESLLKKSKPWFITEKYWEKVSLTAQETVLNNLYKDRYSSVEASCAYLFLNGEIEAIRDIEVRTRLCDLAYSALKNYFFQRIYYENTLMYAEVLLQVKKPKHIDESKWLGIMSGVQEGYVNILEREFVGNIDSGVLYKSEDYRFDLLTSQARDRVVRTMKRYNLCNAKIILCNSSDVSKDYKRMRSVLEGSYSYGFYALAKAIFLVGVVAESSPEKAKLLLENSEWLELLDKRSLVNMIDKIEQSAELFDIFESLVSGRAVDIDRCVHVNDRQKMLAKKVANLIENEKLVAEKAKKIDEDLASVGNVRVKVLSQLDFIDKLLSNPSQINRVEEYEDTFSRVNYQNLKKIFYILTGVSE